MEETQPRNSFQGKTILPAPRLLVSGYHWKLKDFPRKDQDWAHLVPTACTGWGAEMELVLPLLSCLMGRCWACTSPCPMLALELTAPSAPGQAPVSHPCCLWVCPRERGGAEAPIP